MSDIYSATEASAFFGVQEQRLGLQQEKVSQYLRGISEMTKGLFQIVRELRILEQRLELYEEKDEKTGKPKYSNQITLKGYYIDLVEGGAKSPASVYGLAQQVGFATLPDLFFRANPAEGEDTNAYVETHFGDFNEKVKDVLKRKLTQFENWKKHTGKELKFRFGFQKKYLKQHYHTIRMYAQWIKPYLKHIKRLTPDLKSLDLPDMIAGMEQAMLEMEFLVRLKKKGNYIPVNIITFLYRTAPQMSYQTEYQRGPIHVGRTEMTFKAYAWKEEELDAYMKSKNEEELELLGSIDSSIQQALDSLGDELKKFLLEKGEKEEEKEKKEKQTKWQKFYTVLTGKPVEKAKLKYKPGSALDPFISIFKGFGEMFEAFTGFSRVLKGKEKGPSQWALNKEKKAAITTARKIIWVTYNIFKKAHGMVTW